VSDGLSEIESCVQRINMDAQAFKNIRNRIHLNAKQNTSDLGSKMNMIVFHLFESVIHSVSQLI